MGGDIGDIYIYIYIADLNQTVFRMCEHTSSFLEIQKKIKIGCRYENSRLIIIRKAHRIKTANVLKLDSAVTLCCG